MFIRICLALLLLAVFVGCGQQTPKKKKNMKANYTSTKKYQESKKKESTSKKKSTKKKSTATAKRSEERRVGKECRSRWSPDH